jgi:hypothetical protein
MIGAGHSDRAIAEATGVPRSTITRWRLRGMPTRHTVDAPDPDWRPPDPASYAYLLGLYLGDGCVSPGRSGAQLGIYLDAGYPGIVDEADRAVRAVAPGCHVGRYLRRESGVVRLQAWSPTWLVAFPQHGPGKKHERPIELAGWQREITHAHPRELLRGLIHSDGCRTINRFAVELPVGGRRTYSYPRYFFSNLSAGIRAIFT